MVMNTKTEDGYGKVDIFQKAMIMVPLTSSHYHFNFEGEGTKSGFSPLSKDKKDGKIGNLNMSRRTDFCTFVWPTRKKMSSARTKCQKQKQDVVADVLALLAYQQTYWPTRKKMSSARTKDEDEGKDHTPK